MHRFFKNTTYPVHFDERVVSLRELFRYCSDIGKAVLLQDML